MRTPVLESFSRMGSRNEGGICAYSARSEAAWAIFVPEGVTR